MASQDAYGRLAYSGLIAWPQRLQREAPLFQRILAQAPSKQVLDLGCGSGEHTRFLASLGYLTTGVDASPSQLASARAADPQGAYVLADLSDVLSHLTQPHGAALCIGNTLPHLCEEAQVRAFFSGLGHCLLPGAPFLLQLLNYDRILDRGERTLPMTLRPGGAEGTDTVFLRLMTHHGGGRITFTPATLRYAPGTEAPLELLSAQSVALRGWRRVEVESLLRESGFQVKEVLGSMTGDAWGPGSSDLVVLAERL